MLVKKKKMYHWSYSFRHDSWFTCEFCVKDLFVLLPDLLLMVFKQALTQVADLPQCERGLVLSWGTCEGKKISAKTGIEPLKAAKSRTGLVSSQVQVYSSPFWWTETCGADAGTISEPPVTLSLWNGARFPLVIYHFAISEVCSKSGTINCR